MISLLILLQLSVIIFALSRHDKVDGILDNAWQRVYDNNPRILQDIETRLACCGYSSVGDRAVPKTSKYACRESPAFGYTVSCQRQIKGAYLDHEDLLLSVVTSIQFLQILALVAAVALWSQLPRSNEIEDRYRVEHSQRLLRGMREDQAQRGYRDTGGQGEEQERYGATEWSNR
ncbi:hypothetical protein BGZ54_005480 [Gamsiella multidivaricata]|nr:hypothetical protein BGZ54_005480 [Gamsiella multidivaricata]